MTGPRPEGGTDWNALYGVQGPQYRTEYDAGMQNINRLYDQFRQMEAMRSAQGTGQPPQRTATVPTQQVEPAHAGWTDEDLVGAATYWGLPEDAVRAMPRQSVIDFVNSKRVAAQDQQHPILQGLLALSKASDMFQVGAMEAITGGIQHLPGIGDWLSKQRIVKEVDLKTRQREEAIRALTPEMLQPLQSEANIAGNLAAMWSPGAGAWSAAGKVVDVMPLVSRLSPIGRAAFQGGLSSYLLAGGTKDEDEEKWKHRGMVVGLGTVLGAAAGAIAPQEQALANKVTKSFVGDKFTGDPNVRTSLRPVPDANALLQPADMQGLNSFRGMTEAHPGNWDGAQSASEPDFADLVLSGDPQAAEIHAFQKAQGLAGQMNKAATIIQSPEFPAIASQTQIDDASVAQAALADNPGGHSIVQGVTDPPKLLEKFGENARFVKGPYSDRLDMIVGQEPLPDFAASEYEKWGVFSGQRVLTSKGIGGTIKAVDGEGGAYVEPLYTGRLEHHPIDQLHPWTTSPSVMEAPDLWSAFQSYTDSRAAETQAAMGGALNPPQLYAVKNKSLAPWMEDFLDQFGVTRDGDRARVREYFNQRWVQNFKDLAPAEHVEQNASAASALAVEKENPLQPLAKLDQHAAVKGYVAIPLEGGKVALVDQVGSAEWSSRARLSFDTREAAETWVKGFNRELPDITPASDIPLEVVGEHPAGPQTPPNTNELHADALVAAVKEVESLIPSGPPNGEPPAEVHGATGNHGALQRRYAAAISWIAPQRRNFSNLDQLMHLDGKNYALATDFDHLDVAKNLFHTAMEPHSAELADLLAPVGRAKLLSGEWAQAYETLDPAERAAFVARNGWKPKEIASLDAYDNLMQKLFPETDLEEIRQIPRYFSHISQRQSVPDLMPRAFEDFSLGKTTKPFYEMARTGNLNMRELDPRIVGDTYIRAVMWEKHMAATYNGIRDKWANLLSSDASMEPVANLMNGYLDIVKGGYHPKDDFVLNGAHWFLKTMVDPAITRAQAKEVVLGGLNQSYAGLIGYRPNMIARHFLQLTYAYPRAGNNLLSVLGRFATSAEARSSILAEATADGAISPRSFTRNAPGAIQGELEAVGTGLPAQHTFDPTEPVAHTARYKMLAKTQVAVADALPDFFKGHEDSVLKPMGAFSKAVERFRAIVYVSGKEKAAEAIANYRESTQVQGPGSPALDRLMGESAMRTYDPSWQRQFQELVASGQDDEAAKFAGRQLSNSTFFMYGTADAAAIGRSVTGKIGMQLGHYELNYIQMMREYLANGTIGDKAKVAAMLGTTTMALVEASRKSGWNFRWLNPWGAVGFGGGPLIDQMMDVGKGVAAGVKSLENDDTGALDKSVRAFSMAAQGAATQFAPWGGLMRAGEAVQGAQLSPTPGVALGRYAVTGEVGPGPDIDRQLMPQADEMFRQSLQPHQSPLRGDGTLGVAGQAPPQFIVDPAQLQSTGNLPSAPGVAPSTPGYGVAPGGIEVFPRVNPQIRRR